MYNTEAGSGQGQGSVNQSLWCCPELSQHLQTQQILVPAPPVPADPGSSIPRPSRSWFHHLQTQPISVSALMSITHIVQAPCRQRGRLCISRCFRQGLQRCLLTLGFTSWDFDFWPLRCWSSLLASAQLMQEVMCKPGLKP